MKIEKWDEVNGVEDTSDKLQVFLDRTSDSYAILQLRRTDETFLERFAPYWQLEHMDITPNIDHYETVYVDALPPFTDRSLFLLAIALPPRPRPKRHSMKCSIQPWCFITLKLSAKRKKLRL